MDSNNSIKKSLTTAEAYCFYVITLCFLFFGYIVVMSYNTRFTLPTEAGMIMTAVISLATGTSGYIIGSNSASKGKDEMIKQALNSVPINSLQNLVLKWTGAYDAAPLNPQINDAYHNNITTKNYYWNGSGWIETQQQP